MTLDPYELELRQATYAWIHHKYLEDDAAVAHERHASAQRAAQAPDALALVERLGVTRDVDDFRQRFNSLVARRDSYLSLSGPNGHTFLNQLVNLSPDPDRLAGLLVECLTAPSSEGEAAAHIAALADFCDEIKQGGAPQRGRTNAFLSTFWLLADPTRWPARWPTASQALERLGWSLPDDQVDEYLEFASLLGHFGPPEEVLATLRWYAENPWIGPDPTIERRVRWADELKQQSLDRTQVAFTNVAAMLGPLRHAGDSLAPRLGEILDRVVTKRLPNPDVKRSGEAYARTDAWVMWVPELPDLAWQGRPGLRLHFAPEGMFIGLHPGYRAKGWIDHIKSVIEPVLPDGLDVVYHLRLGAPPHLAADSRDFHVGRFHRYDELDWDGVEDELLAAAAELVPVLQRVLVEGSGEASGGEASEVADTATPDELRQRFREFVAEKGYPTDHDRVQITARERMAALLAAEVLGRLDLADLRQILNSRAYGGAGNQGALNATLASDDPDVMQAKVVAILQDLLHGDDDVGERIDRALPQLRGLGITGVTKLLAIVDPDRFIPVFPLTGPHGKLALLPLVGVHDVPAGTLGQRNVAANDLLRTALATVPELRDDPWGQQEFVYWLRDRGIEAPVEDDLDARLRAATDECTLAPDSRFLWELHDLLGDKRQIVLYGPPGTGKTWVAQELAKAIAPEPERRTLVQFHPSTAYEDFMEGYRPVSQDGQIAYHLTPGPLIELAERASVDPRPHVLVIDEMNRANLPKVFGELLFLLEYRGEPMRLAYRNEQSPFALPANLWVIGTMNLADRSVGQIDAALRRRFAFVPFSPNDEHNGGLLARWLSKTEQPTWPADLVDEVNAELEADLGHNDLLIGPSYFMKADLDEELMGRIWRYAIEPLAADLFHGDQKTIDKYSWRLVTKRHRSHLGTHDAATTDEAATGDDEARPGTGTAGDTATGEHR